MNTFISLRRPRFLVGACILVLMAALTRAQAPTGGVIVYNFTTLAGLPPGSADGTGSAAQFGRPQGVAVDNSGNVYVADIYNNTIRKITPAGVVTTLAGTPGVTGNADGTGATAQFNFGNRWAGGGVAVDGVGNVYVADTYNDTIRKVTPAGVVTTLAGTPGVTGSADGTGSAARFNWPQGVAVDSMGNVYVADTYNDKIRKITPAGVVTTLAGAPGQYGGAGGNQGSADGTGATAQFNIPGGVAVDSAGNVYVADSGNDTIRKITPAGVVTTLAGMPGQYGDADGTGSAARFSNPRGVAVDSAGIVYVADSRSCTIRQITPAGVVTTLAGMAGQWGSADGTGSVARFGYPAGVAVDGAGNVFVADTRNTMIRKVAPAGVVTTLAGTPGQYGNAEGTGSAARFSGPQGVAVDSTGNVYVADGGDGGSGNGTIRKITPAGVVTTLAGTAGVTGSADGAGGAARFGDPASVAVDAIGNVYVADSGNNTIRKVTPAGVVTTLAGVAPQYGSADGTGSAARFNQPQGVAVDTSGNVYVSDSENNTIRKITPAGVVTTLAGAAGQKGSADGTGSAARFGYPAGVAVDGAGNVYVADTRNNTIRQITPAGVVTTLAGTPGQYGNVDGTGSAARFGWPYGVAVDSAGNIFVADSGDGGGNGNDTIRQITPAGVVTTLGGTPGQYGSADGIGSAARFNNPQGVAVDSAGNVYVADTLNSTIRKGTPMVAPPTITGFTPSGGAPGSTVALTGLGFTSATAVLFNGTGAASFAVVSDTQINAVIPVGATSGPITVVTPNGTGSSGSFAVGTLPIITAQPASQTLTVGSSATFMVTATGSPTYQWSLNGVALVDGLQADGSTVSGATSATLTITGTTGAESDGTYTVTLTNGPGLSLTSAAAVLSLRPSGAGAASFTGVGDLPGGVFSSCVRAATEDGQIAVGSGSVLNELPSPGAGGDRPVLWTSTAGMKELPEPVTITAGTLFLTGSDITPDGAVIAGRVRSNPTANRRAPAIWTNDGKTLTVIPEIAGYSGGSSAANCISNDGTVVYGWSTSPANWQAFRWTAATGTVGLGFLNASDTMSSPSARCVSADGSVMAGDATASDGTTQTAFIYTVGGGMRSLGHLPGGTWSGALALTPDGATVLGAGDSTNFPGGEYFIWTQAGGMVPLGVGDPNDVDNFGGISADGQVFAAGGYVHNGNGFMAVDKVLENAGVNITGWSQFQLLGMSRNGNVLFGEALDPSSNYEGWVATLPSGFLQGLALPATITDNPSSQTTDAGSGATFMIGVSGGPGLSVQWYLNGVALADGTQADGSTVSGSTSLTLQLGNLPPTRNGGSYTVQVSNSLGRETSSAAVLTVTTPVSVVAYNFTTLAGSPLGSADGTGSGARFNNPRGVAVDNAGNVYVADTDNCTVRKVTPAGAVTTLAGTAGQYGSADGMGGSAQFNNPTNVAVDSAGNVYVADSNNNAIRKITPGGAVSVFAGGSSGAADGTGGNAQFNKPEGVAVDSAGNVYVADSNNNAIRKIDPSGNVTTIAGGGQAGFADGTGSAARFWGPPGLAVDGAGNVYVADSVNSVIRKVTPAGVVTTLAGSAGVGGYADGIGSAARFNWPTGVAVDGAGNVYVADSANDAIREVNSAGVVSTLACGIGSADGTGGSAQFYHPWGVALDSAGNLYVADSLNNTIRKMTISQGVGTVTTLAGQSGLGSTDGTGSAARFFGPFGVAVDSAGNICVADSYNDTIREVTPAGVVTTLAGSVGQNGSTDGTGNAARFYAPQAVAVDSVGNVYVADNGNDTIRKVTPAGAVTTLAGSARQNGSTDGAGSAARFAQPQGVAVDSAGNVYVADTANDTIRKITSAGVVTTLAGSPGQVGSVDGTGSVARFNQPRGVAVDGAGNVYVADTFSNTIRMVTPAGVVTTLAGTAGQGGNADGTGSAAQFFLPSGIAVDSTGNVYVADLWNDTIRMITPGGVVSTLAGTVFQTGSTDGTGSAARFYQPQGVAVDGAGNVYVADSFNDTIRKGTPTEAAPAITTQAQSQTVNTGATATFVIVANGNPAPTYQWQFNGADIPGATNATLTISGVTPANAGQYDVVLTNAHGTVTSSVATLFINDPLASGFDWTGWVGTNAVFQNGRLELASNEAQNGGNGSGFQLMPSSGANGAPKIDGFTNALVGTITADWSVQVDMHGSAISVIPTQGFDLDILILDMQAGQEYTNGCFLGLDYNNMGQEGVPPLAAVFELEWNNNIFSLTPTSATDFTFRIAYTSSTHMFATSYSTDGGATWITGHSFDVTQPVANGGWGMTNTSGPSFGIALESSAGVGISGPAVFKAFNSGDVYLSNFIYSGLTPGKWPPSAVYITTQPSPQFTVSGGTAVFSVAAIGHGTLQYQWYLNGIALTDENGASGSATATLSLTNVQAANAGSYTVVVSNGGSTVTSAAAQLTVLTATITSINPAEVQAGRGSFALTVTGSGFVNGATVLWNGAARPTTFVSSTQLTATIPAADIATVTDLQTVSIAVQNPAGYVSNVQPFTVVSAAVTAEQAGIAGAGTAVTVSVPPAAPSGGGVTATLTNATAGSGPATITVATYGSQPVLNPNNPNPLHFFRIEAGYYDVQIAGVDSTDSVTSYFYWPSTITPATEGDPGFILYYFDGTTFSPVKSSGGVAPAKNTTDDLDGTVSGGRFTVMFDTTSTPRLSELTGKVFAIGIKDTRVPATVTLGGLTQTYDGAPKPATATTVPAGLAVTLTYDGSTTAPTNVGSYLVVGTVADPNYLGTAAGTLTIHKAAANVTLGNLRQNYDGNPKQITVTTTPLGLAVNLTYNGGATPPVVPGSYAVVATINDPNHVGSATATLTITVTALVRHAPALNGSIDGSIQVLSGESFTLNGNMYVSGDLLVPGTPTVRLNGHPALGGTLDGNGSPSPSGYVITLNGNAIVHRLVRHTDPITLSVVNAPPPPAGTRDVTLNSAGQSAGNFATVRNLTLNGNVGQIAVPPGTYGSFTANGSSGFVLGVAGATAPAVYNLQSLTLNGNSQLQVVGPVILTLANSVTFNGAVGSSIHLEWLTLNVYSGGVTLNGNVTFNGWVIAPAGAVIINGNSTLNGGVMCDRLTVNGNGLLSEQAQ